MRPPLYSFRRCPYAMRARLAIASAGVQVELREIVLRDKPQAFLDASPSATVPCLVTAQGAIDESLDIMKWALAQHDPEGWLDMPDGGHALIEQADGPFKSALDRTKYAIRYPDADPAASRAEAHAFLARLEAQMGLWLFDRPCLADYAILPFVRQFAFIDKPLFDAQPMPRVQAWLARFTASERFAQIMPKYAPWQPETFGESFP
ncbi:MAG: glutathione S-transferase [Sulfitobacter sp.]